MPPPARTAVYLLCAVYLGLIFGPPLLSQVPDEDVFYSDDDCLDVDLTWDQLDEPLADGHAYLQMRYKNETTGEMVWDDTVYPIEAAPLALGQPACGLGLWSWQMRLSNPAVSGGWDYWQTLTMVHITPYEHIEITPQSPTWMAFNEETQ